ncbi:MAG: cytochrome c [Vicinamibacterales bacterium]
MKATFLIGAAGVICAAAVISATATAIAHDRITTKVSWDREIAAIVQARCMSCHVAGGRGPMPLTSYEEARPWARAIKEEVLTRRMPKWQVVRGYGDFKNDPTLSPFEIGLIAAWADGGAPRASAGNASAPVSEPSRGLPAVEDLAAASRARSVSVPCSSPALPAGRILGLSPIVAPGAAVRLTLRMPDGLEEPLLWIRNFDPKFAETYWLRNPLTLPKGARMSAEFSGPCRVNVLLTPGTAP